VLSAPVLHGRHVRLEPLAPGHLPGLIAAGCDPALWQITVNDGSTPEAMQRWVESALEEQRRGTAVPFATVLQATGQVVGGSRFGNIAERDRRAEIGWTWVARAWQRTAVNTEAKYLMLRHAFETWGLVRVEFKTDAINQQSRAALLGIGAREEGVLRRHALTWTGRFRDSVFFSILDDEWPAVKARLEARLAR
jgi:RimJ/RimL family protein N-acetyltransferase